jgi:signal transduction histidine kinase
MSHELRTPLTAIIGFSQVLGDRLFGDLNDKQIEYIKDIEAGGEHLLGLINDILDLAKIEAGKMELELSPVEIKDLLEHCFVMIKEKCIKRRIALELVTAENVNGLQVSADARKLKQVMYNLLSNASKFTPAGGRILVEAKADEKAATISVQDTGIGIEPGLLEKIFEEFFQVEGGTKDKTPGTGLGLSLARKLVELHGGRIWAESQGLGSGSRFSFEIPIRSVS